MPGRELIPVALSVFSALGIRVDDGPDGLAPGRPNVDTDQPRGADLQNQDAVQNPEPPRGCRRLRERGRR